MKSETTFSQLIVLLVAAVVGPATWAQDILVLKNGDRITGEIKQIWDGEITIEPEYSDEFNVDVPAVEHIISEREFEIEFEDGREIVATMPGADAEGNQILESDDETLAVPVAALFELDEPEDYYDWDSHVDFTADLNKGNTDTFDTQLRADGMYKHGDHRHRGEITFLRKEVSSVPTQERDLYTYSYNWLFRDPWFLAGGATYESDPIAELDGRTTISAGLGRDIWDSARRTLNFSLSAGYQNEKLAMVTRDNAVASWVLRFSYDLFGDDMEVFHNHTIMTNVSGRTNTKYDTSTGLRYEITDLLYANVTLNADYETDPADGVENEDIAFLVGVGLEFE